MAPIVLIFRAIGHGVESAFASKLFYFELKVYVLLTKLFVSLLTLNKLLLEGIGGGFERIPLFDYEF